MLETAACHVNGNGSHPNSNGSHPNDGGGDSGDSGDSGSSSSSSHPNGGITPATTTTTAAYNDHRPRTPPAGGDVSLAALTEGVAATPPYRGSVAEGGAEAGDKGVAGTGAPERSYAALPDDCLLPDGHPDYIRLIAQASSRVYEACRVTPLTHAAILSNRLECRVLFKREDEQPVFSFKLRGAYNKMAHLDPRESWRGVVCCSAGNHAQGVAFSARKLKIPATIIMPEGTPSIKHLNVSRLGGHVVLHGADFDAAREEAARREQRDHLINIPPFDDPYVIAGQGTIGMELFGQVNMAEVEAVFAAVGGGGLIAGVGTYIRRMAPHVRIIGVEAADANAMAQSLQQGSRVRLRDVGLFADGAAVKTVGEETFRLCRGLLDQVIEVSTDEVCAAIRDMYDDTRSGLEPAGALSIAGLKRYAAERPTQSRRRTLIAITSGANMNFDRLRFVAERATLGDGKEALLAVGIPERPGAFAALVGSVMPSAVTEFSYRYASGSDVANVLIGISLPAPSAPERAAELAAMMGRMKAAGMSPIDLSGDELAKSHVRYLAGGRSAVPDERLYMFNFPERPGALDKFLIILRPRFNISLFQYRNYGGDVAKILTGIQCPNPLRPELERFLNEIGYPWEDCTDSDVYRMFLRA